MKSMYYAGAVVFAGAIFTFAAQPGHTVLGDPPVSLQASTPGTVQTGHTNISGVALAGAFRGNGSGLTNLSAPNIVSGLLNDARLGPNVALINRMNTFSGVQRFASNMIVTSQNASLIFGAVGAGAQKPMITMFLSGTSNATRMVLGHSPSFPDYGLQYEDSTDKFHFLGSGVRQMTVSLEDGFVGIGKPAPIAKLDVAGSTDETVVLVANADTGEAITAYSGVTSSSFPFSDRAAIKGESIGTGHFGVLGISNVSAGVFGFASGDGGYGIYGRSTHANSSAGYFNGHVIVTGNHSIQGLLAKGGGSFKIDHPLDPENKFLYHSFVESPDMMNIYNGIVTTDEKGYATVRMPEWFDALNRDFRYQLTVIDGENSDDFVMAKIVREMAANTFILRTSAPRVKVSWMVTGIRQDAFANAHRIQTEVDKKDSERGLYLHPTEHGQPESRGIATRQDINLPKR